MAHLPKTLVVLCALLFALATPRAAAAQASQSIDQVLGALADVLKDRAQRVAVHTLKRKLVANLCDQQVEVATYDGKKTTIYFGGGDSDEKACGQDNVFTSSCKLANQDIDLGDAYFLRELGRETVNLAMRLAAIKVDDCAYANARLPSVADYLFEVMAAGSTAELDLKTLGALTTSLADKLDGAPHTRNVLKAIKALPELEGLRAALSTQLAAKCAAATCDAGCKKACELMPSTWILSQPLSSPPTPADEKQCKDFRAERAARKSAYQTVFSPDSCGKDYETTCQLRAQLVLDLAFYVGDILCNSDNEPEASQRKTLRQFSYLLWNREAFKAAAKEYFPPAAGNEAAAIETALDNFAVTASKAATQEFDFLPQAEIASAIRTIGLILEARAQDQAGLEAWASGISGATITQVLNSPALHWRGRDGLSPSVTAVRDSLKDLLTLPRFSVSVALTSTKTSVDGAEIEKVLAASVRSFVDLVKSATGPRTALSALANVFYSNAEVAAALSKVSQAIAPGKERSLTETARVLKLCGDVLSHAKDRDWVGVSITAIDLVPADYRRGSFGSSLTFTRTLMSMYQAKDRAEAKAIFEAKLSDEDSREKRFDAWAVDFAGHLAARGGVQLNRFSNDKPSGVDEQSGLYGLYAPMGLQVAKGHFGVTAYPVDVGSYLTVTKDQRPRAVPTGGMHCEWAASSTGASRRPFP